MKKNKISKLVLATLIIVGFSGNLFGAEMFASVESKVYKNYYNNQDYHSLKGEYNLDNLKSEYLVLKDYKAEIFAATHIYTIDSTRDIGEEFFYGKNNKLILLEYTFDIKNGFNAGVYKKEDGNIIVAFGGTTAKEKYLDGNIYSAYTDALTDLNLLNNKSTDGQIYEAVNFIQNIQTTYPNISITAVGHSLGGGLAQIASLASKSYVNYSKVKAVTFNTAPVPITAITKKWIEDYDKQKQWSDKNNINFMTDKDPLTNTLKSIENYKENDLLNLNLITGESRIDNYFNNNILSIKDRLLVEASAFAVYQVSGKALPTNGLKLKELIILKLEKYLSIKANKTDELIYGKRILLNTNTGHTMSPLLNELFNNIQDYSLFKSMFVDIPENTPLYDGVFNLIKNHSISYPKLDRDYKFYPKIAVTSSELKIFIINSFFYQDYIEELKYNKDLTRDNFFSDKIPNLSLSEKVTKEELNILTTSLFFYFSNIEIDKMKSIFSVIDTQGIKATLLKRYNNFYNSSLLVDDKQINQRLATRGDVAMAIMKLLEVDYKTLAKQSYKSNREALWQMFVRLPKNLILGVKK